MVGLLYKIVDRLYSTDMGRTSDARQRILTEACQLIHQRGYNALGVADICAAAGTPKGSFYHFFESKQALTLAVVETHWQEQHQHWQAILEESTAPPLKRLQTLFEQTAAQQHSIREKNGVVIGCMFANLALELSTQDKQIQAHLETVFKAQVDLVQATLQRAVSSKAIPKTSATRETAQAVLAQLEGRVLFAKIYNNPSLISQDWQQILGLIHAFPVQKGATVS